MATSFCPCFGKCSRHFVNVGQLLTEFAHPTRPSLASIGPNSTTFCRNLPKIDQHRPNDDQYFPFWSKCSRHLVNVGQILAGLAQTWSTWAQFRPKLAKFAPTNLAGRLWYRLYTVGHHRGAHPAGRLHRPLRRLIDSAFPLGGSADPSAAPQISWAAPPTPVASPTPWLLRWVLRLEPGAAVLGPATAQVAAALGRAAGAEFGEEKRTLNQPDEKQTRASGAEEPRLCRAGLFLLFVLPPFSFAAPNQKHNILKHMTTQRRRSAPKVGLSCWGSNFSCILGLVQVIAGHSAIFRARGAEKCRLRRGGGTDFHPDPALEAPFRTFSCF